MARTFPKISEMELQVLSKQEEEAMLSIWKKGAGVINDFLFCMEEPRPLYNTLASTIKNLEKKKYVKSRKVGNVYEYYPIVLEIDYKRNSIHNIVSNHFSHSYKDLVSFFAEENKISSAEVKEILDIIANGKNEK